MLNLPGFPQLDIRAAHTHRCCLCRHGHNKHLHATTGPALAGEMGLHGVVAGTLDVQCMWAGAPRPAQWGAAGGQNATLGAAAVPPMPPLPPPQCAPRPPLPLDDQQKVC
jgi:hypothetical protein